MYSWKAESAPCTLGAQSALWGIPKWLSDCSHLLSLTSAFNPEGVVAVLTAARARAQLVENGLDTKLSGRLLYVLKINR